MRLVAHMEKSANREQNITCPLIYLKRVQMCLILIYSGLCFVSYSFMYLALNNLEIYITIYLLKSSSRRSDLV